MKLSLTLPDELYAAYAEQAGSEAQSEVADFMVARLDHFRGVDPRKGWMHLDSAAIAELETLTSGSIPNPKELLRRVEALSHVSLGGVRLDFTAAQLSEIERRAKRNGESAEVYLRRIVKMMEPMFFTAAG